MRDYAATLRYTNETIKLIERARRQERRLQKAYKALRTAPAIVEGSQFSSQEFERAQTKFDDERYFLIVVLRQVIRGRELMEHLGYEMPPFRQEDLIKSWRDVEEHWDAPPRGKTLGAMQRWQDASDESAPGLSHAGAGRLELLSGLELKSVRKDLREIRRAVGDASEREWQNCYLTQEQAAEILGLTIEEFEAMPRKPFHLDFENQGGVRYWREWVEAFREGYAVPPRWVENQW